LLASLALVQVGLLAKDLLSITHAAREGAREAAVTRDESRVRAAAIDSGELSAERTVILVNRTGGVGAPVTVTVRYRAPMLVPFVDWLFPDEVSMEAAVTMRQETD
jgi:hypothetical protein